MHYISLIKRAQDKALRRRRKIIVQSLIIKKMKPNLVHKTVGEYKYFYTCRFCGSDNIRSVIDLGLMPLAGGFIKKIRQKWKQIM